MTEGRAGVIKWWSTQQKVKFPVSAVAGFLSICLTIYALMQLAQISVKILPQYLPATYLAAALVPFGVAVYLRYRFDSWVNRRRSVEPAEIEGLYAEVCLYGDSSNNQQATQHAQEERNRLKSLERSTLELDVLPLRQALVDLYRPEQELISKVRRELELLQEYASVGEYDLDEESSKRVNETIDGLRTTLMEHERDDTNNDNGERREQLTHTLRAELKILRERVAWYDYTWAYGELLRQCVTWWALAALSSTFVIGILPLVHSQGSLNIGILHWTSLGAFGALLALLLRLQQLDLPELGETRGKQLLQGMGRSVAIGAAAAALLYFALWGGALDGKAFPNLPTQPETGDQIDVELFGNVGLSAFWAILAGLSPVVLKKLTQIADTTLGESRGDPEEE